MLNRVKWITYLSLDAPLVAVCWQALLARCFDVTLAWYHVLILLSSVWLGYAADRWLDNQKAVTPRSERHRFYAKHDRIIKRVWLIVFVISLLAALVLLTASELVKGFALVIAALLYTAFAQKGRHFPFYGIAKSAFIAVLIVESAALFIPVNAMPMASGLFALLAVAALFTNNCLLIRSWSSRTHRPSERLLQITGLTAMAFALIVAVFWENLRPLAFACFLSLAGLFLLSRIHKTLEPEVPRSLADIILLTPILVYPFS